MSAARRTRSASRRSRGVEEHSQTSSTDDRSPDSRSGERVMRIPYDVPKVHMYTRIRKSPFFYASRRHGVQSYSVCNRMYHPRHYDDPIAEYWRLVHDVTLWDVGVERQVEVTGPDAFTFTNLLTPRDLAKCEVGQCMFVLNTDVDGGISTNPVL